MAVQLLVATLVLKTGDVIPASRERKIVLFELPELICENSTPEMV